MCVFARRKDETRNVKIEIKTTKNREHTNILIKTKTKTKIAKHSDTGTIKLSKKLIDKHTHYTHIYAQGRIISIYWYTLCLYKFIFTFAFFPYMRPIYQSNELESIFFCVERECYSTHQLKWLIKVPTDSYCSLHALLLVLLLLFWSWILRILHTYTGRSRNLLLILTVRIV